jgi:uncharacterized protein
VGGDVRAGEEEAMNPIEHVRRTTVGAAAWEPCLTSDGRTIGEAEWLRRRTDGTWSHTAMLWRCDPMSFEYNFAGDESFLIISGLVRIELKDAGETIELRTGDVASFQKGTRSVWTIIERVEKFTVISG